MSQNKTAFLALGSNQNNPRKQITQAINHIQRLPNTALNQMAPWYETAPWGVTEQADFINTVISIQTNLAPLQLLKLVKRIEYRLMNRRPNKRWHSRSIDIDILYYPRHFFKRRHLRLPHPHMHERCFVLRPLLDLNPPQLPPKVKSILTLNKRCCVSLTYLPNKLEKHKIRQI